MRLCLMAYEIACLFNDNNLCLFFNSDFILIYVYGSNSNIDNNLNIWRPTIFVMYFWAAFDSISMLDYVLYIHVAINLRY